MSNTDNTAQLPPEDDFRPSAARLVDSLRDTGYSPEAAFADIIDNSIAADATRIRIELVNLMGELRVIFTDNGKGMSESQLLAGMRYGAPKREDPKSLGKFGMGLKTASTAFCQRLVVLSIRNGADCIRAWDLDTIRKNDRWELENPDKDNYYDEFEELKEFASEEGSGTMVIWEKIDRLVTLGDDRKIQKQLENLGNELKDELSAVFGRFLDHEDASCPNVSISVVAGSQPEKFLQPWDPLCQKLNTGSSSGARVKKLPEKVIRANMDGGADHTFNITGSILPSQNEMTEEEQNKVRYTLDNQGFYIYREGRLIWHDGWPQRMYKKEGKITRLRVVLDFTHELDDLFKIDFRKSRIIIPKTVRDELKKIVAPWRNHTQQGDTKGGSGAGGSDAAAKSHHQRATNAIDKHKEETKVASIQVDDDKAHLENRYNRSAPVLVEGVHIYPESNVRVREETSLNGNVLWNAALDHDGETCVQINQHHEYFRRLYATCKDNPDAIMALDMLLWSLANAEFGIWSEKNKVVVGEFRQFVSSNLNHLCQELPDPQED